MNDRDTVPIKDDVAKLHSLARLTPAVVAAIVGIGLGIVLLQNRVGGIAILELVAWVFLLVSTLVIFFAWWLFPPKNLTILYRWFRERPSSTYNPQLEQLAGVALMVVIGALFVAAFWPMYYSIVFVLYSIMYYIGVRHLLRTVRLSLDKTRIHIQPQPGVSNTTTIELQQIHDEAYRIIEHYHFHHKHLGRIGFLITMGIVAFGLALVDSLEIMAFGTEAAAFLMGTVLLGMEILISIWRTSYYRQEAVLSGRLDRTQGRT